MCLMESSALQQLDCLLERFNLFEALGQVRRELRHSDFLAFLLDPRQNHGLGDTFTRLFIRLVNSGSPENTTTVSIDSSSEINFHEVEVRREWKNIDILLIDHAHERLFVIENKIDADEHSDQLVRYRRTAYQAYPGWQFVGIFLTPDGSQPSSEEYLALGYQQVGTLLQNVLDDQALGIAADVRMVLTHYVQMLGRHIMSESDTAKLCRQIYRQHKQALDLIFQHRDDQHQRVFRDIATKLIKQTPELMSDWSYKWNGRHCADFIVRDWHTPLLMHSSTGKNKCLLIFSVKIEPTASYLELHITPGDAELRQKLLNMALSKQPPFQVDSDELREWHWIYGREFLTEQMYEDASDDALMAEFRRQWSAFLEEDLPMITGAVTSWRIAEQ